MPGFLRGQARRPPRFFLENGDTGNQMAITVNDQQILQALLGVDKLPDDVVQEAELRTRMYHGAGAMSGPLGPLAMIELVRFLGYRPKKQPVSNNEAVIWRNLPTDGSVKITAGPYFGSMQEGVYLGMVSEGLLAIKLNTDGFVRECRQSMVKLSEETHEDFVEEATPLAASIKNSLPEEPAAESEEQAYEDKVEELPEFSWLSVSTGAPVWVSQGDDKEPLNGSFLEVLENGKLSVKVEGKKKPMEFEKDTVLYAG